MSDVRFLTEASFVIGLGVGWTGGLFVGWDAPEWVR